MAANTLKTDGDAIRALRKAHGLKLYELAKAVGVTDGHLGKIERGNIQGTSWVLRRIANHLGVPLQKIVTEELPACVAA